MTTITVRQAVLSDLEALAPLFDSYRQFYGRPGNLLAATEFLLARFNHGESVLFIAHEGNQAIGFTQLYPSFSSVSLARTFVLNDLFVCEHARRKGVASKLMSAAVDYASSLGAVRCQPRQAMKRLRGCIKPLVGSAMSNSWFIILPFRPAKHYG